jgi:hypothetical protein
MLSGLLILAPTVALATETPERDELMRELRARDQAIADLAARLRTLEDQLHTLQQAGQQAGQEARELPKPQSATATTTADRASKAAAEDIAAQALSRTLVERGALLLPEWALEVSPSVGYSHNQTEGLGLATLGGGFTTVTTQRLRQDEALAEVDVRLGLPWDSQATVRTPFSYVRNAAVLGTGDNLVTQDRGVGDVELEISHQFVHEAAWRPDLLAAFTWRLPTGSDPYRSDSNGLATGQGVPGLGARLTASKSLDPLVIFANLGYTANLAEDKAAGHVKPGDAIEAELGAVLAISPEASLNLSLVQRFTGKTQLNGTSLSGTDRVESVLRVGASAVLGRNTLLDFSIGIGLTGDSPDYQVMLALPVRFAL